MDTDDPVAQIRVVPSVVLIKALHVVINVLILERKTLVPEENLRSTEEINNEKI